MASTSALGPARRSSAAAAISGTSAAKSSSVWVLVPSARATALRLRAARAGGMSCALVARRAASVSMVPMAGTMSPLPSVDEKLGSSALRHIAF
eukprot:scaffold32388_cov31-Prasinocladus_malaysianus.AAC.1